MAVVAVRERPAATVGTHDRDTVPALDIADPDMTREARLARAVWRREHPEEWQQELEALCHFDPDFIYDPAHEYDAESTTDPDYDAEGIHFVEFDADGVVSPLEKRAREVQKHGSDTASDMLADTDWEGDYERLVRFRPETIARANQVTRHRHPVRKGVRPDMLVRAALSPSERERFMPDGVLRLDWARPSRRWCWRWCPRARRNGISTTRSTCMLRRGSRSTWCTTWAANVGRVRPGNS